MIVEQGQQLGNASLALIRWAIGTAYRVLP